MSLYKLNIFERQLDNLFAEVSTIDEGEETKAHLSRYLCVRTSGYLENVTRILIANFCDGTSPQPISNYISKRTKYITNLELEIYYLNLIAIGVQNLKQLYLTSKRVLLILLYQTGIVSLTEITTALHLEICHNIIMTQKKFVKY